MKNTKEILYWILILLILFIPLVYLGNNPGLYLDAVMPDYGAVQILHPNKYSVNWFEAFPILCAMYHGCINLFISLITIGITGHASVLQHHLTNGVINFFILLAMDKLLHSHKVSRTIRRIGIVLVACLPTLMTFCLTQYYIELPGCLFVILSAILYDKIAFAKDHRLRTPIACFFLLGLAFYSYFNYLFFFPGFLILYVVKGCDLQEKIKHLLIACYSFACGAVLYFIGYSMVFFKAINKESYIIPVGILLFLAIYAISFVVGMSYKKSNYILPIILTLCIVLCLIIGILLIAPSILAIYSTLGIFGAPISFLARIKAIYQNMYYALSGTFAETLIYGEVISSFLQIYSILFFGLSLITIIHMLLSKKCVFHSALGHYFFVLLVYLLCCIPFVSHMHTQHFVPAAFWTLLLTLFELDYIFQTIKSHVANIIPVFLLVLISLNVHNTALVAHQIKSTGGTGLYTNQINILAEEALENAENGYKEAYIFPEWGFLCGFDYLTQNTIAFSDTADVATIENFLSKGYTVQLLYWNYGSTDQYLSLIKDIDANIELQEYSLANHEGVAFIRMQISPD